jgi:predicted DNA-binding protein (MmcQ/YjbR family)
MLSRDSEEAGCQPALQIAMKLEEIRRILLAKRGATEEIPFGPGALVYKVMGKMFALVAEDAEPLYVSLKCEPGQARFLRDVFPAVRPGYHMNKTHWNSVTLDDSIPLPELLGMIDDSYDLVVKGLTRAKREELASRSDEDGRIKHGWDTDETDKTD